MAKTLNPNSGQNSKESYYEQIGNARYSKPSGSTFGISSQSKKQCDRCSTKLDEHNKK